MWQIIQDPNMFNRLPNEAVQIQCVRKFFDMKTFRYLCDELEKLKDKKWPCSKCKRFLNQECNECLSCLDKFHENCSAMTNNFYIRLTLKVRN